MTPDRIKEELQWLRTLFPIVAATIAALIAYIAQGTAPRSMLVVAGSAAVIAVSGLVALVVQVYRLLKRL